MGSGRSSCALLSYLYSQDFAGTVVTRCPTGQCVLFLAQSREDNQNLISWNLVQAQHDRSQWMQICDTSYKRSMKKLKNCAT